jgi:hypothetical protein
LVKGNKAALNPEAGQHGAAVDLVWGDGRCFLDPDSMGSSTSRPIESFAPLADLVDWDRFDG